MRIGTVPLLLCLLLPAVTLSRSQAAFAGRDIPRVCATATQCSTDRKTQPVLFAPYVFGLPRAQAMKLPGAAPGEGDFAGDVILPEAAFAGLPWTVRLEFRQDALVRVSLMGAGGAKRLAAVNNRLREMGFEMLAMLSDGVRLDFLSTLKIEGSDGLQRRIEKLHDNENPARLSYAWFDTRQISRETKVMTRNLSELLQVVAAETREAEVTLLGDGKGGVGHMLVDFSLPVLELQTYTSR